VGGAASLMLEVAMRVAIRYWLGSRSGSGLFTWFERERSELVGSEWFTFRPHVRLERGGGAARGTAVGAVQRSHSEISTPETL